MTAHFDCELKGCIPPRCIFAETCNTDPKQVFHSFFHMLDPAGNIGNDLTARFVIIPSSWPMDDFVRGTIEFMSPLVLEA
jgi:hypothetical protein